MAVRTGNLDALWRSFRWLNPATRSVILTVKADSGNPATDTPPNPRNEPVF